MKSQRTASTPLNPTDHDNTQTSVSAPTRVTFKSTRGEVKLFFYGPLETRFYDLTHPGPPWNPVRTPHLTCCRHAAHTHTVGERCKRFGLFASLPPLSSSLTSSPFLHTPRLDSTLPKLHLSRLFFSSPSNFCSLLVTVSFIFPLRQPLTSPPGGLAHLSRRITIEVFPAQCQRAISQPCPCFPIIAHLIVLCRWRSDELRQSSEKCLRTDEP